MFFFAVLSVGAAFAGGLALPNHFGRLVERHVLATTDTNGSGTRNLWQAITNSNDAAVRAQAITLSLPRLPVIAAGATVTVNSTTDLADGNTSSIAALIAAPGPGGFISLREAITAANNNNPPGAAISFNIPGSGVHTIVLMNSLPPITSPVTIDGYTQEPCGPNPPPSCSKPNTLAVGSDATLLIQLSSSSGLRITGSNSIVKGLIINGSNQSGIQLDGSGNTIAGCFIGTDPGGTMARANAASAVKINDTANNTIGGLLVASRNLLSGNTDHGVDITGVNATGNTVLGNLIGTTRDGTAALSNIHVGVKLEGGASNNTVGGTTGTTPGGPCTGACNLISENGQQGVTMFDAGNGNSVVGNFIGTSADGLGALPNTNAGILIVNSSNELIGGTSASARNLISGNIGLGIQIMKFSNPADLTDRITVQGNVIGTTTTGAAALANGSGGIDISAGTNCVIGGVAAGAGNAIAFNGSAGVSISEPDPNNPITRGNALRGNSIHDNAGLGIDLIRLIPPEVNPNDDKDTDFKGPNTLQNFPDISSATASVGAGNVNGSLNSIPGNTFTVDFYANAACDPSGNGEGDIYLGSTTATTDPTSGITSFTFVSPPLNVGQIVTATATDSAGNTSEFSSCVTVTPGCITSQPTNQTVCAGATASFSVSVSGANPTFQWRKDGSNIQGATSATLTINNISFADRGFYDVQVSDTCSSLETSSFATLAVNTAPNITTQPIDQTVCAGGNVSLVSTADGSPAPTIKWQVSTDGVNFSDTAVTSFAASASDNGKQYRAVFTNGCGIVTTRVALLTVNTSPAVTTQPTDQTVCDGAPASFSVTASGTNPTFRWLKGATVLSDGGRISGATTAILTISNTSSADAGSYTIEVSGDCIPSAQSSASLIVNTAPSITTQPTDQTVCDGSNVSFVAAVGGSPAPSVRWQSSTDGVGFSDTGVTSATLSLTASAADNGKQYRAVFTNSCGRATTNAATLIVNTAPSIITQPTDQTVCPGNITFTAAANGSPAPSVQWQEKVNGGSFTNMPGPAAINPTLTFAADTSDDGNQYRAVFTNSCGSTTTNPASLTVTTPMLTITSRLRSPFTVPGNSDGRVVIPDLTSQVTAISNCGLAISFSQLPVPGTQVGPEPTPVTVTVMDSTGNTFTSESIINSDGDSDGIEASIDRNRISQAIEGKIPSNDFVTRTFVAPAESSTSGTVTHRGDQNVHVIPSSVAGGVQASISGGTFGSIHPLTSINAFDNPLVQIGLNTFGQVADITRNYPAPRCTQVFGGPSCLRTRVQALQAPLLHPIVVAIPLPRNRLTIDPRTDLFFRIALQQGQIVYVGSPITADPGNQRNIEIEILHNSGSVLGSLQLPPGQTVDFDQEASRELVVTNLDRAPLALTFNGIDYTLSPGQALRPSLGPRAIYQEVLNDVTALREKTADKRDREKLNKTITQLIAALDAQLSTDAFHLQPKGGKRVFDEAKDAVNLLLDLIKNKQSSFPDTTTQAFINALVNANRQLADIAINDAVAARGAQRQINKANEELSRGDSDVSTHRSAKAKSAIDHYRGAWKHAMNAAGK